MARGMVYSVYIETQTRMMTMTRRQANKLAELATKLEASMLNDMGPDEYKSYMAMPQDHRFKIVCAALASTLT
jgi:hypothetical protein